MTKRVSAESAMLAASAGKSAAPSPASTLPTLQRNALRKIFDRPEFTPEEVAQLGLRRLRLAECIGEKGMKTIIEWLAGHGCELAPENIHVRRVSRNSEMHLRGLARALRLLRGHGYEISAPESMEAQGKGR